MPLAAGTRLGPYEILGLVGAGGMGEVYRARDPRLGREVAVKVLPDDFASDRDRLRRFEQEARAVAALSHPNVVVVYDVGTDAGMPYVVTELLEGETLGERLRKGALPLREAVETAVHVAQGLAAAHAKTIAHRDLKPANVFLTVDGRVKLLDFGLARWEGLGPEDKTASGATEPGTALGTVGYMSPEQVRGGRGDHRSDIFSFGVLLYEMVSGRHPFRRTTGVETQAAILREEPLALSGLGLPEALERVMLRCLEKRPEDRFHSAHDLALALQSIGPLTPLPLPAPGASEPGPYPGLRPFTEEQRESFFGREAEVGALWEKLQRRKLLSLIGPSGVGKTSFLRAGLVPARPSGWRCVTATPGRRPFASLARALVPELASDTEALQELVGFDDPDVAVRLVGKWRRRHAGALVVVDQLEELFALNPPEVQAAFAELLRRLCDEADVHVLLSLRDDFFFACHAHPALAEVFTEVTPLGPLAGEALRRALVEPARKCGFRFEDEALVEEMCAAVEGERGALPLLAFCAAELWERRERERKLLTRAACEGIGGVGGALAQHAEATLERIGTERQGIVREIFRNLVTAQGTRAACEREELLSAFPDRKAAEEVLNALVDARLLTSYEDEIAEGTDEKGCHRIEIVHESLLKAWPRLVRWLAQDEEGALLRDQLKQAAHLWEEKGRPADLLWSGTSYQELELWRKRYPGALTALEEDFAKAMVERARRRKRLVKAAIAAALIGVSAVATVVSVLRNQAVRQAERAGREARLAVASKLVAIGRSQLDRYPAASLAYARRSLETADNPEARRLAVEALWRSPSLRVLPMPEGGSWRAAFSPDGETLAVYAFSGNVLLYPEDGRAPRKFAGFTVPAYPPPIAFSPKGDALLTWLESENRLRLTSVQDGREIRRLPKLTAKATFAASWAATEAGTVLFQPLGSPAAAWAWELWPWEGDAPRRVAVVRQSEVAPAVDGRLRWAAVARNGRVLVRPVPGGVDTPERQIASYDAKTFTGMAFSPRAHRLAIRDSTGQMAVLALDVEKGAGTRVYHQPKPDPQFDGWFDASGSRLVWGSSSEGFVSLWDLDGPPDAGPRTLRRPDADTKQGLFDPRGGWLAVTQWDSLVFWAVAQPWPRVVRGHGDKVSQLVFTPDSKWVLSCAMDGARRWPLDPAVGEAGLLANLDAVAPNCYGIAVSPDGREALRSFGGAKLVSLHASGGRWLVPEKWPTHETINAVAFDPSGAQVAVATNFSRAPVRKVLRVWERSGTTPTHEWPLAPPGQADDGWDWGAQRIAFLDDRWLLVSCGGGPRRFDLHTGASEMLWRIDTPNMAVSPDMAVSQDRRFVAASAPGGSTGLEGLRSWTGPVVLDLAKGTHWEIRSHGNQVGAVAFDPGGHALVTGDTLGAVRVGAIDGSEPHLLLGHTVSVWSVVVSPDGKWIASAAGSEIRLWPMPDVSKPPLHTLPHEALLAKLGSLTNVRVVEDAASPTGYKLDVGPFPGWKDVPTW